MAILTKFLAGMCLAALVSGAPGAVERDTPYSPKYRISPIDGSKIALPTKEQLDFQDKEIGLLVHFQIATYISIDGCNDVPTLVPPQSLFDPTLLNTDQWMDTAVSLGAKYATLVAKHNCGFTTWPSTATFQTTDNKTVNYNYTIAQSPVHGENVVKSFVDSAEKYGIGHGFYYSVVVNNFLNVQNSGVLTTNLSPGQVSITNATYDQIVLEQLRDLWTNYGKLTEVRENRRKKILRSFVPGSVLTAYRSGSMAVTARLRWTISKSFYSPCSLRRLFSTGVRQRGPASLRIRVRYRDLG